MQDALRSTSSKSWANLQHRNPGIHSAYSSVLSGLSYLCVGFLPQVTAGLGRLESGFVGHIARPTAGCLKTFDPGGLRAAQHPPALFWLGDAGSDRAILRSLAPAGADSAKAMRRNMTYPWHMFFLSGRGVLFCAQRGTCAVLFEFTAVMLCVPGVATFFKGSSCCSHDQLGWTARAGKNAASV